VVRFLIGVIAGFAAGMAVAMLTGGRSGDELRAEFERFREEIQNRDMDALGGHLDVRFKELQGGLEERLAAISDAAASVARDATARAQEKVDAASSAAADATADVAATSEQLADDKG
jgi:gas vesicle protein